jgi:DNA-binding Lrp family transcriptional regulator
MSLGSHQAIVLYDRMRRWFSKAGRTGDITLDLVGPRWRNPASRKDMDPNMIRAYVMIHAPGEFSNGLVEKLKELPGVEEVDLILGDVDAVAVVLVKDNSELTNLIINRIHTIPTVQRTETYVAMDKGVLERSNQRGGTA